jgi:uncharacterized protein YodC (DUF2158 family)
MSWFSKRAPEPDISLWIWDKEDVRAGDVVRLASGGPEMTVEHRRVSGDLKIWYCTWYDDEREEYHGQKFSGGLVKVKND